MLPLGRSLHFKRGCIFGNTSRPVVRLLYDYLHGKDFAQEGIDYKSPMVALTKKNLPHLEKVLDSNNWKKFDYRKFSKVYNPKRKKYDFNIGALLW